MTASARQASGGEGGGPRSGRPAVSGPVRALLLALPLLLPTLPAAAGCGGGEPPPRAFARREPVPLGPLTVRVTGSEEVTGSPAVPLNTLYAEAGRKVVVVFVTWSGMEALAPPDRARFVESFLTGRSSVVDREGYEYRAIAAMPLPLYTGSGTFGALVQDWVLVFHPWVESRGMEVRFVRPDSGPGGFRVASVPLP